MSKAARTREFIIEKTAPIFNKKGFSGTSLQDMTTATGLTKGSIYSNFANKNEVALAVFDHNWQKLNEMITTAMKTEEGVVSKLLVYANVYQKILLNPFLSGGCPILNTAIEADDTHPPLRKKASEALTAWTKNLVKLIDKGVAHGELKTSVKPEDTALALIALVEGSMMISKVTGKHAYTKVLRQAIENFILQLKKD